MGNHIIPGLIVDDIVMPPGAQETRRRIIDERPGIGHPPGAKCRPDRLFHDVKLFAYDAPSKPPRSCSWAPRTDDQRFRWLGCAGPPFELLPGRLRINYVAAKLPGKENRVRQTRNPENPDNICGAAADIMRV